MRKKTTNLYRMTLDTATTVTPATSSNVESVEHRSLELKKVTVPEGIEEEQSIRKLWRTHRHLWKRRSRSQKAERHGLTIACTLTEPGEQNEMIVSSVFSVLLQGTATTRKIVDDDCSREYRKNVVRSVWKSVVRRPVERSSETP